jgi:hypothetical protein
MIFLQQLHELPAILLQSFGVSLEEDELSIDDGSLVVDLIRGGGRLVSFGVACGGECLFFILAETNIRFSVDVTATKLLRRELKSEAPQYLILLLLNSEKLISEYVSWCLVLIIFFHGRTIRYNLYIAEKNIRGEKRLNAN